MAAVSSLISTDFHSSLPLSRYPNRKSPLVSVHKHNCVSFLHNNKTRNDSRILSFIHQALRSHSLAPHKLLFTKFTSSSSALDSLFLLCTSLALSVSLFVADVDPASAFVVTTPRKLQSDELATVRLFQENTPSVVYITNLAVKYFFFFDSCCFTVILPS